jgi:hypothetical protein
MSLDVATSLAKVADDPDLIDRLLAGDRLDDWTVDRAIKQRYTERSVAEREAELVAAGTRVLTADETSKARRLDTVLRDKADRRRHAKEPCHAAAVSSGWDGVSVVVYCTDPRRHRPTAPEAERSVITAAPTVREVTPAGDRRTADNAARSARQEFLTSKVAGGGLPQAATARFAFQALVAMANHQRSVAAASMLGIKPTGDASSVTAQLAEHAMTSAKNLVTVAALVAAMTADERTGPNRTSMTDDPLLVAYYQWLTDIGYEPTDHERQLLYATVAN